MNCNNVSLFRKRYKIWVECISGKSPNSIGRQVSSLMWNAASFNLINHCFLNASGKKSKVKKLNAITSNLLIRCYFTNQIVAIRRLTDKYPLCSNTPNKDVYSIISLLNDIYSHLDIFTRGNLFSVLNLEYDTDKIQQAADQYLYKKHLRNETPCGIPNELDWMPSQMHHEWFDTLSGKTPETRSSSDIIDADIIKTMKMKLLSVTTKVDKYVNKYIAHAAVNTSIQRASQLDYVITLNTLDKAYEMICKIHNLVDSRILRGIGQMSLIPEPQYDILKFMDHPLADKSDFTSLRGEWNKYKIEKDKWLNQDITAFVRKNV